MPLVQNVSLAEILGLIQIKMAFSVLEYAVKKDMLYVEFYLLSIPHYSR